MPDLATKEGPCMSNLPAEVIALIIRSINDIASADRLRIAFANVLPETSSTISHEIAVFEAQNTFRELAMHPHECSSTYITRIDRRTICLPHGIRLCYLDRLGYLLAGRSKSQCEILKYIHSWKLITQALEEGQKVGWTW
ncbi:uncharacterized protein SPPG_09246 [Spizellomyces punctatus DAOM BR117]|uniref:Uncharacterized protein n=1 Tax=Spizellomyces punctatus (strain DAOM BR117) TaxID=645134 RepID=A0A0L0HF03_SPIPD|nr:uncharacterized protein SPPG_09246 [Spizellomyces punctatus DAOM BR117]KNC99677.1 hypothetical protein SPPG_09246 [Spizellomyces punctatus DAOM BR117]|eukprot:XP_016607717.1 hypothetical protein SPPG_09246 [Spizellomyces punctatus DAOM BR117]